MGPNGTRKAERVEPEVCMDKSQHETKGIVHQKITFLSIIHPQVVLNPYKVFCSVDVSN